MKHQGLATSSALKVSPFWREEYPDRVEVLGWVALLLLFLLSGCSQEPTQPELPVGTPVSVTADLQVSVLPFTSLTDDAATRANVEMSAAEKEIKSAYVVQFDGTSPISTAVWVSPDVSTQLKNGTPVTCSLTLSKDVKSRVYVVVNPQSIPTVDMTLQAFETVVYTVSSTLPSTGLPMAASQDVTSDDAFSTFQLKCPFARLTFTTNLGTLTLCGIPSAYSLVPVTAGDAAVRPSGVTYTNTLAMTSGTAYYVPANLSGCVTLSDKILRCATFAPANSMYVTVSANNKNYNYYLGDGSASDFNVSGNCAYTLNAIIKGTGNTFDMRIGTPPAITALDTEGTANCYIATAANKWYSFNGKVMGNGKSTPLPSNLASGSVASAITPSPLNPVSTDVLWETWNTASTPVKGSVVQGVYLADGKVIFRSGTSQGNAVIAARDSENNIIWSWHIWRTDVTPATQTLATLTSTSGNFDATGTTTLSGLQMMDRNLGALSATPQNNFSTGLHYQWGRKDPFPSAAGISVTSNVVMATYPEGILSKGSGISYLNFAGPNVFHVGSDWTTSRNDNLWGTPLTNTVTISNGTANGTAKYNSNAGSKTIYDPCPPGWRVPPGYVFANAAKNMSMNQGYSLSILTSGSSWFPAVGYRSNEDGTLVCVVYYADYWTSSASITPSSDGGAMNFDTGGVFPYSSFYRSYGFSVRCVKE